MRETEEEIRHRGLPINRAIHQLRSGIPENQITSTSLGVTADKLLETVSVAKLRMVSNDKAYAAMTQKGAIGFMAFGAIMLALAYYLAVTDIPVLRQGRLLACVAIGCGSLAWGMFRLFNRNLRYEF